MSGGAGVTGGTATQGLVILPAELGPGARGGFTGRTGGVGVGQWAGLNLGLHVQDEPRRVLVNRDLLQRWTGVPVAFASQVHGARVAVLDAPPAPGRASVGTYDALVTAHPDLALAVLAADCVPLLLADPQARVVAAVHVGRGGLVAGVIAAVVDAMVGLGARTARMTAVIGPAVCGRCYEVPGEMRAEVDALVPGTAAVTSWGTASLDIPAGVRGRLGDLGVAHVHDTGVCTMADDRFYSHRRDGRRGPTGRFAGVVQLVVR